MGVYRAAFATMEQTEPLVHNKVRVPVVALGGERAQGARVREMVAMVAENVTGGVVADCAHFLPEESPEEIARHVLAMTAKAYAG
jgi:pimeloyl-ACP methyl ester carboxylesterase